METALRQISRGLLQCGHDLRVVVSAESPRSREEEIEGVQVRRIARWGEWWSLPLNPFLPAVLRRLHREFKPELVHLHLPNPAMAAVWLAVGDPQIPLVVSYHSDIVRQRGLDGILEPLRQRLLRRARTVVVTSEELKEQSRSLRPHRERCAVVPFGVEIPGSASPAAGAEGLPWPRYYLFVGRMVYYKGLDILLSALAGEEIPLVVVGDGPLRGRWENLSRKLGMEQQVRFLGEISSERLDLLYRACHALVLPSTAASETFGLVQLEAMARGRPVVAARASGGVVSVQEEGVSGLLVPPGDIAALRLALTGLWRDPFLADKMGRAARERVREHFDADRSHQLLCSVLERAVGRSGGEGR